MIVSHIKSPQDLQSKKTLQSQLLDLEISNEAELERRVKDFKNPNKPIPIAPEYKTNAELQQDRLAQERQAISNMTEIGFDYNKSAELVAWLSSSLINKLVEFNANFKGIRKELTETTNPKLINTEYLKNYLEKYFEDMDINYGRKFSKESINANAPISAASLDELHAIIPNQGVLNEIENILSKTYWRVESEIRERGQDIDRLRTELEETQMTGEEIRNIPERDRRDYQERVKMIQTHLRDLINGVDAYYEALPKIKIAEALFGFYSKLLPNDETFNLIKQSLTQQERADMIRRYISALRQSNILSRSGTDELYDELTNEDAVISPQDFLRWLNKAIKALSFVSNESGVSKITKLQRDYEVLLNQNGKVGEYEKLKEFNNIREQDIKRAREALSDAMAEIREGYDRYQPKVIIGDTFNTETQKQIRKERDIQAEREDAIRQQEYKQDLIDRGVVLPELIERMNIITQQIRKDQPSSKLNPAKQILQIDSILKQDISNEQRRQAIEDKKYIWGAIQLEFIQELRSLFNRDEGLAITTVKNYIDDNLGLPKKQLNRLLLKPRDEPKNEYFTRLIDAITDYGDEKIREEMSDVKAFEDYDIDSNLTKALIRTSRGNVVGETRYGLGAKKKRGKRGTGINEALSKHFKEDEGDMRETIKILRKHRKNERAIEAEASSSDDEAKRGGAGVGFRHKKIKVGRGIETKQTPSYLSFGKYVIHMGHLLDRNIANFKYPSLGSIPTIKPLTISEDYKDFILDTIDNKKPNERLFNKLPQDEQKHFERVVSGAGLTDVFKLKRSHTEQEKIDANRFELLRGEVMAGNNSEKVLKELRGLIVRFINEGRLHQREGTTLLMEISSL